MTVIMDKYDETIFIYIVYNVIKYEVLHYYSFIIGVYEFVTTQRMHVLPMVLKYHRKNK